jgi:hypothetical protein
MTPTPDYTSKRSHVLMVFPTFDSRQKGNKKNVPTLRARHAWADSERANAFALRHMHGRGKKCRRSTSVEAYSVSDRAIVVPRTEKCIVRYVARALLSTIARIGTHFLLINRNIAAHPRDYASRNRRALREISR